MIENKYKHLLRNSRSYQGTLTSSDHRIVITSLQIDWYIVHMHKNIKSNNKNKSFNTNELIYDPTKRQEYQQKIEHRLIDETDKSWDKIKTVLKKKQKK